MENSNTDLAKSVIIELQGQSFSINFPNVGQIIDIETKKVAFANNFYRLLADANSKSANIALNYIDSFATFSVLIPDLIKNLRIQSLFKLNIEEAEEIVSQYLGVYFPWYIAWVDYFKNQHKQLAEEVKNGLSE